jgi:hypothetical protein
MLPLTLLWAVGCTPPCQDVCRKILDCGTLESQRVAVEECELSCEVQAALYADWEDEAKEEAFDDHKRCLMQESCDDIAEGVCYDEDIFVF